MTDKNDSSTVFFAPLIKKVNKQSKMTVENTGKSSTTVPIIPVTIT